jgi:hypothetical protein
MPNDEAGAQVPELKGVEEYVDPEFWVETFVDPELWVGRQLGRIWENEKSEPLETRFGLTKRYCTRCGTRHPEGSLNCSHCGANFEMDRPKNVRKMWRIQQEMDLKRRRNTPYQCSHGLDIIVNTLPIYCGFCSRKGMYVYRPWNHGPVDQIYWLTSCESCTAINETIWKKLPLYRRMFKK